jgi:predicted RNA binding protein YcfA (HicA-like mRNA interferase family)
MSKLPALRAREVKRILKLAGFEFARQEGSHEQWFRAADGRLATVPNHAGETIRIGTLKSIMRQMGLSREEFLRLHNA